MTTWFTSDTHFGHANIIHYAKRPFKDVDHMNAEIVRRWNSVVMPDDTVFHLGDVALGKIDQSLPIVGQLNGEIILIIGNHDRIFQGEKEKMQQRFIPEYNRWFSDYYDNIGSGFELDGRRFNLSHFPYHGDSHDGDRYVEMRLPDDGTPLIHGHTHKPDILTLSSKMTPQIHVGQDAWDFFPVAEAQVLDVLEGVL